MIKADRIGLSLRRRRDPPWQGTSVGSWKRPRGQWPLGLLAVAFLILNPTSWGGEERLAARYDDEIFPMLVEYCYTCHGDGMKKGEMALDGYPSDEELWRDRELWWAVLKNVRAGIMPPGKRPRPSGPEVRVLEDWITREVFGSDPADLDPGRVTLRRLNRVEYRHTIQDLMGIDYRTDEEFPPDDTGYGFDTIADVLSVSPLLLEKYLAAAETIVARAVPIVSRVTPSRKLPGSAFRGPGGTGDRLAFDQESAVSHTFQAQEEGTYRLVVNLEVRGGFYFDPGRCEITFQADGDELYRRALQWQDGRKYQRDFTRKWQPGSHSLDFHIQPLSPSKQEEGDPPLFVRVVSVVVDGPLESNRGSRPPNFDRFFSRDDPDPGPERDQYARDVLNRFATKAFRRPCDDRTLDRLVAIAEETYQQPGKSFEQGIAQAMVAVLASPRFLFRIEEGEPGESDQPHQHIDEFALASRLSYFLWSTMPDEELFGLARRGELRKELGNQVQRMLADSRSGRLVENFAGQWLQVRDVEGTPINERVVLARDDGEERELKRQAREFREFLARRQELERARARGEAPPQTGPEARPARLRFRRPRVELNDELRSAMRRETEMFFAGIIHEDQSVLDLLDSDYTYLNEKLANHYGIPGVTGGAMRRVPLPPNSPRGGLLTQGTILVVTSNPTRTSPVKRGLFLLDNLLGTPPPPPPPDVPELEATEAEFRDREPTLREVLELHRNKPLCASCHSRMDPLGLALENFNAMGMWRESERNQPLDTAGTLITGESFSGIRELKRVLREDRQTDFYRCLTEKLLTYALGRGLEWSDVATVDQIVSRLEREGGRFSALMMGIVESAPFQKRRNETAAVATTAAPPEAREQGSPQP